MRTTTTSGRYAAIFQWTERVSSIWIVLGCGHFRRWIGSECITSHSVTTTSSSTQIRSSPTIRWRRTQSTRSVELFKFTFELKYADEFVQLSWVFSDTHASGNYTRVRWTLNYESLVWFILNRQVSARWRPYIDGRSQIKVHTDERTQVHNARSSLTVTHPSTNRGRRCLTCHWASFGRDRAFGISYCDHRHNHSNSIPIGYRSHSDLTSGSTFDQLQFTCIISRWSLYLYISRSCHKSFFSFIVKLSNLLRSFHIKTCCECLSLHIWPVARKSWLGIVRASSPT